MLNTVFVVTEYFISFLDQFKRHWQNQSQSLTSAHINEEQNCLKHLTNLLEQMRLYSSTKNANSSIHKPPQQRFVVTTDLKSAQECSLASVSLKFYRKTSKNIHFLHETRMLCWP